ncbi:Uncharacterized protein APZ42_003930 [Daphnia magna]|uniref:Uncharacterized protein n=1 Tax=Daphnia magna TaxID=35525 RepID=A0A164HCL1_9CRUS|nr:Uncharacterized protein APZ42_003930 [Daphnia magna]
MAIAVKTEHRVLDFSQPYGDDNGLYFVVCGPTMPTELQVFPAQWRCSGVELAGFLSVSFARGSSFVLVGTIGLPYMHARCIRGIICAVQCSTVHVDEETFGDVLDPIGRQPPLQQFNKK